DHGIHPHVTSSDCSLAGLLKGVGLSGCTVDRDFVIAKAPYMTRVGEGVFPTELGGPASAKWCGSSEVTREVESAKYVFPDVNAADPLAQGYGIRFAGDEYG